MPPSAGTPVSLQWGARREKTLIQWSFRESSYSDHSQEFPSASTVSARRRRCPRRFLALSLELLAAGWRRFLPKRRACEKNVCGLEIEPKPADYSIAIPAGRVHSGRTGDAKAPYWETCRTAGYVHKGNAKFLATGPPCAQIVLRTCEPVRVRVKASPNGIR